MIFAISVLSLNAQNKPISGTVTDAAGVPVIGAAVFVVGNTSTGVMTDDEGKYSFSVPANSTIAVSCIGYSTQTITIGAEAVYNVMLQEDTQLLEETVVIGYGVQNKSDLTGSVASVGAESLKNQSVTDAAAALQGRASGVHIINSGAPGSGSEIRVRGYSSNSGKIGPLLIVDGLQVDNIQYLDPSMIESMEVLKDAASAAIYGAQAGNGVVLITTKMGSADKGRASVTYSAKATLQNYTGNPVMNREEFLKYKRLELGDAFVDGKLKDFDYSHPLYKGGVIDQNWIDAYIEPTWSQQHSLTFSGGNNRGSFFTSLNYVHQDGVVAGDKDVYKRLSAQINADYKLFDWMTVGSNLSMERWSTKSVSGRGYGSSFESMLVMDPLTPVYWTDPSEFAQDYKAQYERVQAGGEGRPYRFLGDENGWFANTKYSDAEGSPFAKRDASESSNSGINIRGTLFANLNLFKGFTFTSRFGYRINQSASHSYSAPYYLTGMANGGEYNISANINTGYYYQWENFANYNRRFGKHDVTAMVGMSYIENNSDSASISSQGEDILSSYEPQYRYINYLKDDAVKTVSNAPGKSASLSYFGRVGYSYDNRYSVQANFRADAFDSSKLPASNRWGYFPSVSAGWTMSNESFIKDNVDKSVLSFLKLRGSWGRNGNVNILSGYPYTATISLNGQWYQYNPSTGTGNLTYGSGPTDMPNDKLKWETSEQLDFGIDARLLSDRLSVTVDWYKKLTKDLLVSFAPVPEIGVKSTYANAGNVLNTGLEFELGWKDSVGDFNYGINANFSTLHNEVLSLHSALDRITGGGISGLNNKIRSAFEAGYPIWYFRGYKYAGINTETGAPQYYDKDGNITESPQDGDMQYIGKAIPDATYGITLNLGYKGFDLVVFGTGTVGNDIACLLYSADRSRTNSLTHFWENSWKNPGDNTLYPKSATVANDWTFWSSSAAIFDGSYFKIKQIQLGYTLPQKFTKKFLVNNFRVYASLDDFFTFSSYPGCDPETATAGTGSSAGYDAGSYPTMKKVIFGVNITF